METYKSPIIGVAETADKIDLDLLTPEQEIVTLTIFKSRWDSETSSFVEDEETKNRAVNTLIDFVSVSDASQIKVGSTTIEYYLSDGRAYLTPPQARYSKLPASYDGRVLKMELLKINTTNTEVEYVLGYEGEEYVSRINFGRWVDHLETKLPLAGEKERRFEKFKSVHGVYPSDVTASHLTVRARANSFAPDSCWIEVLALD